MAVAKKTSKTHIAWFFLKFMMTCTKKLYLAQISTLKPRILLTKEKEMQKQLQEWIKAVIGLLYFADVFKSSRQNI